MAFSIAPRRLATGQLATTEEGFTVHGVQGMEGIESIERTVGGSSAQDRRGDRLRSPITWFGGKGILARKIVPLFPPHQCYVEPFCGGASCLFAKPPSPVEVINDLDSDIVNFFRVLRDPRKFERFYLLAALTPYSREEYCKHRARWRTSRRDYRGNRSERANHAAYDDRGECSECSDYGNVQRAYRWYVIARMSFAGELGRSWGHSIATSRRGMANAVSQWLSIVDMLPAIAERVRSVQVEHGDWLEVLTGYDTPDTLFYLDPPFVRSTRRSGRYTFEMNDAQHRQLVEALLNMKGKALLSGYRNSIYSPLEQAGWRRVELPTLCYAVGRTRKSGLQGKGALRFQSRTEVVWVSPTAQVLPGRERAPKYVQATLDL
ncbi:MAG: DNA adenine methylase [Chloroflexi bacterium]|nr:DNA adenine methylase [Chloroflexota bacterium]